MKKLLLKLLGYKEPKGEPIGNPNTKTIGANTLRPYKGNATYKTPFG